MEYYGPTSIGIICFEQAAKYTSTTVDILGCGTPPIKTHDVTTSIYTSRHSGFIYDSYKPIGMSSLPAPSRNSLFRIFYPVPTVQ